MDLIMLLIIAVVIKSVFDSQKAKDNSKNRQGQHPSGPGKPESGKPKPQRAKQETQPTGLEDIFGQMMGKMKESLTLETEQAKPQKASSGQTKKKKTAESSKGKKINKNLNSKPKVALRPINLERNGQSMKDLDPVLSQLRVYLRNKITAVIGWSSIRTLIIAKARCL